MKKITQKREVVEFSCSHCRCIFTSDEYKFEHCDSNGFIPTYNLIEDTCPQCHKEVVIKEIGGA